MADFALQEEDRHAHLHQQLKFCMTHLGHMAGCALQEEDRHARLHQQLTSAVQGLHKKLTSKIRTFEAQLLDVSKVEAVQKTADMITANIYRIPPGGCSQCKHGAAAGLY